MRVLPGGGTRAAAAALLLLVIGTATAQNAPATAPPPAPAEPAPGTPATVIDNKQIESVLGRSVLSPTGEDMGRIVDVLADKAGAPRAVVIDFGGFFGVGSRKIAVDWRTLHFKKDDKTDKVVADLPRDQLKTAPVYKEGEPVVVLGRSDAPPPPVTAAPAAAAPASPTPTPD